MSGLQECERRDVPDGLFLERLEAFMEKGLADIRAFARRENRPFDEIRLQVAEWHNRYLFKRDPTVQDTANQSDRVTSVLFDTSRTLESLCQVSGVHSFILAVDPTDPADRGFLGGTLLGREFWRGLRSGGELGAKNFRLHCLGTTHTTDDGPTPDPPTTSADPGPSSSTKRLAMTANAVKTEIYASVRSALRTTSGIRNAEMKWTNHDRLSAYGVRIVGWPRDIPFQNPSTLTVSQNKVLLDCLQTGSLHFVRKEDETKTRALSWVYDESNTTSPFNLQ